jgi:hypothetical protein
MRFVDNHQIVAGIRSGSSVASAKPFKGQEIGFRLRGGKSVSPHRGECRGRNDEDARVPAGKRCRDERLAHADIVREKRPAKLFERSLESRYRGLLVWLQCDPAQSRACLTRTEHKISNSGADDGGRL